MTYVSRLSGLFQASCAEKKGNKVRTGDTAVVKYSAKTEGARKHTLDAGPAAPPWMIVWSACNGRCLRALGQFPKCRLYVKARFSGRIISGQVARASRLRSVGVPLTKTQVGVHAHNEALDLRELPLENWREHVKC